jgi:hypothetical protein
MADNKNIIVVGNVAFTDKGAWVENYSFESEGETITGYDANDIVHTSKGVFASLVDGNTSEPSDTSANWRLWLDKTAAVKAQSAADDANKAAGLANTAAATATAEAAEAKKQATAAQEKSQQAEEAATRAEAKIAQMDSLAGQIATGFIAPSRMNLSYPADISIRNKAKLKIAADVLPAYLPQSVLYQRVEGTSVASDPSGNLTIAGAGVTKFWVIPTANTPLWREVNITVRQPYMRLSASGKIRKNGNKIRIV